MAVLKIISNIFSKNSTNSNGTKFGSYIGEQIHTIDGVLGKNMRNMKEKQRYLIAVLRKGIKNPKVRKNNDDLDS